jgi:hypothetical protein
VSAVQTLFRVAPPNPADPFAVIPLGITGMASPGLCRVGASERVLFLVSGLSVVGS